MEIITGLLLVATIVLAVICRRQAHALHCERYARRTDVQIVEKELARIQREYVKRMTETVAQLTTAEDIIIEILQSDPRRTNLTESHQLRALRAGLSGFDKREEKVDWLVTNLPRVIKASAKMRLEGR